MKYALLAARRASTFLASALLFSPALACPPQSVPHGWPHNASTSYRLYAPTPAPRLYPNSWDESTEASPPVQFYTVPATPYTPWPYRAPDGYPNE